MNIVDLRYSICIIVRGMLSSMESVLSDYERINNFKKKWLFDDNSVSDYYYEDATTISILVILQVIVIILIVIEII